MLLECSIPYLASVDSSDADLGQLAEPKRMGIWKAGGNCGLFSQTGQQGKRCKLRSFAVS